MRNIAISDMLTGGQTNDLSMDLSKVFSLQGKVAIVTGVGWGIGYNIAAFFAAAGGKVVISSNEAEDLAEITAKLKSRGYDVLGLICDPTNTGQLDDLVEQTVAYYGQLDILVNNAGVSSFCGYLRDLDMEDFNRLMDRNVKVPLELSKICFPYLRQSANGAIVNIVASDANAPELKTGLCAISKSSLIALTKALAKEWGDYRIRVNLICPGLTESSAEKLFWSDEKILGEMIKRSSLKRMCESKEIAAMALFLASPASSFTTGTVMHVDGGYNL